MLYTPDQAPTENGVKRTGRDAAVLPRCVVYSPDLLRSLPVGLAVTSGLNAVVHAVVGNDAPDPSPIIGLMAQVAIRALTDALPRTVADPHDPAPRAASLKGARLCGAMLGATTMSLHHKLCHVAGGTFDLPHSEVHTVVLPHVVAFNAPAAPGALAALRRVLGADPACRLFDLTDRLDAPTSLSAPGMPRTGLAEVASQVLALPYANPRTVTARGLDDLLTAAFDGVRPETRMTVTTRA